ncbi:glutamate-5-semialdehyde dehydrogenase [Arcanobacterium haemolyticum]|nr:glutamate-5-semialdehyde dehydrogenase [Arcanobacterium haemolyticum]
MTDHTVEQAVHSVACRAKAASRSLRQATSAEKSDLLRAIADSLEDHSHEIIVANRVDVDAGRGEGMAEGLVDRLLLSAERISAIAEATREVAALADPVGEVVRGQKLPNGLRLRQVRVPMGVIGMIYEARPNVTVDAAALCLKAGSAVILRGGHAAHETNRVLVDIMRGAIEQRGFDPHLVQTIDNYGREGAVALMRARGLVDLVIPRGGAGLIQTVVRESVVPVIETGVGNCHVYVDASADLSKALDIVVNAKTHRPGVCNAAETLLVHREVAADFLPRALDELSRRGVVLHLDDRAAEYAGDVPFLPAREDDWSTEYLALELAVKVVDDEEGALEHIRRYTTGHTEAIVAQNVEAIRRFVDGIDSAAIMINASTRFTDGGQLGLGAEIGISTQKLHARGPMGLTELTTTTWIVEGDGHVRN